MKDKLISLMMLSLTSCIHSEAMECELDVWREMDYADPCEWVIVTKLMDDGTTQNITGAYVAQCIERELKLRHCRKKSNLIPAVPDFDD